MHPLKHEQVLPTYNRYEVLSVEEDASAREGLFWKKEKVPSDKVKRAGKSSSHACSSQKPKGKVCKAEPDNFHEFNNEHEHLINISLLRPEHLLLLQCKVNGVPMRALIDSGASRSIICEEKTNYLEEVDLFDEQVVFEGLGKVGMPVNKAFQAQVIVGTVSIGTTKLHVAPTGLLAVDLVLGVDFLKANKFRIDLHRRVIEKFYDDGAKCSMIIGQDGSVAHLLYEKVPVVLKEDTVLHKGISRVPVTVGVDDSSCNFYFEGKPTKSKVRALDGIFKADESNNFVFIAHKAEMSHVAIKLRKGVKVGEVSTLIEVEDEDDKTDCPWDEVAKEVNIGESNSLEERAQICKMLQEMSGVFGRGGLDIGRANVRPHEIELSNYTPIWQRPRRFAEPVTEEVERQCEELLRLDIIEHSQSPWSSPIVPVRKKDGDLRLCIDYRKVNSVTVTEKFPMPNMSDAIYSARDATYFSKLDLVKGYYQIPLEESSRQYTAFSTPHNHYQFKTLSFGLKNSGIYFQRTMQEILAEFGFKNIIVYIDDILIMSETFEEHMMLTRKVLQTLRNNGIQLKASKCEFFKQEIEFLGHVICGKGICKSPAFIEKIKDYPKPNTIIELRQFLGLANFQGRFVQNLAGISKPLTQMTSGPKKKQLCWTPEMEKAFCEIRQQLAREVMLSFPDYSESAKPLELSVDASGVGAGGCLQQMQEGEYKTIAYASMTFTAAQTRYSTIERELCAIRWGIKFFRPFLFGIRFILYTDHKPLLYLQNMSHENSRLMRTIEELAEYDFQIKYKPGQENVLADVMSRSVMEQAERKFEVEQQRKLPEGMTVLQEVKGGGDSMFVSLCLLFGNFKKGV